MRPVRTIAVLTAAAALALTLAACSSGSDPATSSGAASPGTSTAGLPAPVIVEESATTATVRIGETVVFNVTDPATTTITVDDPALLSLTPGRDDGSATFNPGGQALAIGEATVTLTGPDGTVRTVVVTITPQIASDPAGAIGGSADPATAAAQAACDQILEGTFTQADAEALAKDAGLDSRIGSVDGTPNALTMDYNPQRVTFTLQGGLVTDCTVG